MAIQSRRGAYRDFDPSKLLPGELAVVLSGDPDANSGRSVYICFDPGVVKRFTTYEDFETELDAATADIRAEFTAYLQNMIDTAVQQAVQDAVSAAGSADTAASAANTATSAANSAAARAEAAAKACEDLLDGTAVTTLQGQMEQVIEALSTALSTG